MKRSAYPFMYLTSLTLILVSATIGDPAVDDCVEQCITDHDEAVDFCNSEYGQHIFTCQVLQDICDQERMSAQIACNEAFNDAFAACQGDPECEAQAQADFEVCTDESNAQWDLCVEEVVAPCYVGADSIRVECLDAADAAFQACLDGCAVPYDRTTWGEIKGHYRSE